MLRNNKNLIRKLLLTGLGFCISLLLLVVLGPAALFEPEWLRITLGITFGIITFILMVIFNILLYHYKKYLMTKEC